MQQILASVPALTLLACSSVLSPLTAQTAVTSPKGFGSVAGNASFAASTNRRYMALDATHLTNVLIIKTFGLRRSSNARTPGPSTVDMTLSMGGANMSLVHSEMERNYLPNTKTVVFPKKQVNWPDWSTTSPTPLAFDFKVSLPSPYVYLGITPLIWDLVLENGTITSHSLDRQYTFYTSTSPSSLGTGCTVTGQGSPFQLSQQAQSNGAFLATFGMRLKSGCLRAPASAPVGLSVALTDANLTLGSFCASLHALPLVTLPLGSADPGGTVHDEYFNFPFDTALQGFKFVTQAFASDNGALVLSNGTSVTMPTSAPAAGEKSAYIWCSLTTVPNRGIAFHGGNILAEFGL